MLENEKKNSPKKERKKPTKQTHKNLSLQAQRTPIQPTSNPQTTEPEPFLSYS
jgi:hypothetical protein